MRDVFQWLVYSSKNPQVISLTIKGLLPLLILLGIDAQDSEVLSDSISQLIMNIGLALSAFATLWGIVRKVWLSFK